ncbi:triacylglycerol lipase [Acrasis kona]|uniref:Lipase n=1 Tax=Acrasis kona TaxID=1008807 RepID=A0AAW2ZI17_9EUKA
MKITFCLIFLLSLTLALESNVVPPDNYVSVNVTQLIEAQGYPCEQHDVVTKDGFILSVQRIPHGRNNKDIGKKRRVVFLQHGLLDASSTWVNNFYNQSLGFILADFGYDVFLGNVRGNRYSMGHTHLKPDSKEFWEWSLDEMAAIDLPAMIEYTLNLTKQEKLDYVGHSQGCVIALACFSQDVCSTDGKGNIAQHINTFFALAPAPFVGHITSPLFNFLGKFHMAEAFKYFGFNQFSPSTPLFRKLLPSVCQDSHIGYKICINACKRCLCAGCDSMRHNVNMTRLPIYVDGVPAGTSVQNMIHWSQAVTTDGFQMLDYGSVEENMKHYNQEKPPSYNVTNIKTDIAVFYGGMDSLGDAEDISLWLPMLPQHRLRMKKYYPSYGHLDFVWSFNAARDIYESIVDYLR